MAVRIGDRYVRGEPGGQFEAGRRRGDVGRAQQRPVVPSERNRQGPVDGCGDVTYVHECSVLPERLPFRPRLRAPLVLDPAVVCLIPDRHRTQGYRGDPGPRGETLAQILGQPLSLRYSAL